MRIRHLPSSLYKNIKYSIGKNYSKFLIASDGAGWVLDEEGREIIALAKELAIEADFIFNPFRHLKQCIHYTSQFSLLDTSVFQSSHKISLDYFHGKPEQGVEFAKVYDIIKKNHQRLSKIRVSYSEMEDLVLSTGIDRSKVHRIPIGINPDYFQFQNPLLKKNLREKLNLPQEAFIVGSFQKDGTGWGEGNEPKLVKGPDVFIKAMEILKNKIPELYVILTGPSRGFIKNGLEKIKVPYQHYYLKKYEDIGEYYGLLDAYLIASREEGGPKAVLESMISGVPLVTTRVGQAIDLVKNKENGFIVNIEDAEAMAHCLYKYYQMEQVEKNNMLQSALQVAQGQTYKAQIPKWKNFFQDLV